MKNLLGKVKIDCPECAAAISVVAKDSKKGSVVKCSNCGKQFRFKSDDLSAMAEATDKFADRLIKSLPKFNK